VTLTCVCLTVFVDRPHDFCFLVY